jgi:hypothetical protein
MFSALDRWFWRDDPLSFSLDHVKSPPFLQPKSRRLLHIRGALASFYVVLLSIHMVVLGKGFWVFCTNWNLFLTALTFSCLFAASYMHRDD